MKNEDGKFEGEKRDKVELSMSDCNFLNQWQKLNDMVAESILARLPTFDLFRCQFVNKSWGPLISSPNFKNISNNLFTHQPWFLMVDLSTFFCSVFDKEVDEWRLIRLYHPRDINGKPKLPFVSSNGLMCFISYDGRDLTVCNPLTGSSRDVSIHSIKTTKSIVIAMHVSGSTFQLFVINEALSHFIMKVFSSIDNVWVEKRLQRQIPGCDLEDEIELNNFMNSFAPREQAGLVTLGSDGQVIVNFLDSNGTLVGCDSKHCTIFVYPQAIPQDENCSFAFVECGGRILIVALVEDTVEACLTIRVSEFKHIENCWKVIARMPPEMTREYEEIFADEMEWVVIDCAGYGDCLMVCVSSDYFEFYEVVLCNLAENTWVKLPKCLDPCDGSPKEFISAHAIMPNLNASVKMKYWV